MSKKEYLLLYLISISIYSVVVVLQKSPGYMDAQYYYAGALQLINGKGWVEPYIWNYMNISSQLPVPSFLYWMPLTSILAALGMFVFHSTSYLAARLPFLLLAGLIPPFTAFWTAKFTPEKRNIWLGALVALFCGYYLPFITHTDTFVPYFILGSLFFLIIERLIRDGQTYKAIQWPLYLGIIAGCMHLSRADGILWIGAAILVIIIIDLSNHSKGSKSIQKLLLDLIMALIGYLFIMGAWYIRNFQLFGWIFPPDNGKNLLLTQYNDLFYYPTSEITLQRFLQTGFDNISKVRFQALGSNAESIVAVMGSLILIPFMIVGLIKNRKNKIIQVWFLLFMVEILLMSIIFPFAGYRGGFFHSGSAFQILLWAMVPSGFAAVIHFGEKKRNWRFDRAWKMFGVAILLGVILITANVFKNKFSKNDEVTWDTQEKQYESLQAEMKRLATDDLSPIMIGNPPGYYLASQREAVAIPEGGPNAVLLAASKYNVKYLVLDEDIPESLTALYNLKQEFGQIQYIENFDTFRIFRIIQQ